MWLVIIENSNIWLSFILPIIEIIWKCIRTDVQLQMYRNTEIQKFTQIQNTKLEKYRNAEMQKFYKEKLKLWKFTLIQTSGWVQFSRFRIRKCISCPFSFQSFDLIDFSNKFPEVDFLCIVEIHKRIFNFFTGKQMERSLAGWLLKNS